MINFLLVGTIRNYGDGDGCGFGNGDGSSPEYEYIADNSSGIGYYSHHNDYASNNSIVCTVSSSTRRG